MHFYNTLFLLHLHRGRRPALEFSLRTCIPNLFYELKEKKKLSKRDQKRAGDPKPSLYSSVFICAWQLNLRFLFY